MGSSEGANLRASVTTSLENPIEKIEKLLTCAICLDRYKHPKILPCQHTFCLSCLEGYADTIHRHLKCPECRAEHSLDPYEGVKALPSNLTLAGFLDIHLRATNTSAAEFQAYIETYNLERCKICDEKAQLQVCAHCERKACEECRKSHIEMLKRDLARLLTQVKRLSNRLKEASSGLGKNIDSLLLNGENTKAEIRDYFRRYRDELTYRERHFLGEVDAFVESERRIMSALADTIIVEATNIENTCMWTDTVLNGSGQATDLELSHAKAAFVDSVEYLRNFQPDSEELFSKKLRFSPGDDASKLPSAIVNFGELTVSLPQFGNRYLPLEEQYLPKLLHMPFESDAQRTNSHGDKFAYSRSPLRYEAKADSSCDRYRRRAQLEEEAWNRLRTSSALGGTSQNGSRCQSPMASTSSPSRATDTATVVTSQRQPQDEEVKKTEKESPANELRIDINSANAGTPTISPPILSPSKIPKSISPKTTIIHATASTSSNSTTKEIQFQRKDHSQVEAKKASEQPELTLMKLMAKSTSKTLTSQSEKKPNVSTVSPSLPTQTKEDNKQLKRQTSQQQYEEKKQQPQRPCKELQKQQQQQSAVSKNGSAEELPQNLQHNNDVIHGDEELESRQTMAILPKLSIGEEDNSNNDINAVSNDISIINVNENENNNKFKFFQIELNGSVKEKEEKIESDQREENNNNENINNYNNNNNSNNDNNGEKKNGEKPSLPRQNSHQDAPSMKKKQRSRILYRSSSSRPLNREPLLDEEVRRSDADSAMLFPSSALKTLQPIRITHYPYNSCGEWPKEDKIGLRYSRSLTNPHLISEMVQAPPKLTQKFETKFPFTTQSSKEDQCNSNTSEPDENTHRSSRWHDSTRTIQFLNVTKRPINNQNHSARINSSSSRLRQRSISHKTTRGETPHVQSSSIDYTTKQHPVLVIGRRGSEKSAMNWPRGVCALPNGEFALCDSANHRVQIFNESGRCMRTFGEYGSGNIQFDNCAGIAYHVYRKELIVTDRYNHRVQMFDLNGHFVRQFGSKGTVAGKFNNPWGIAVDELGLIYIVDKDNHRVQIFDCTGKFINMFGCLGDCIGQFNHPLFIAIQPNLQNILVSDSANHRICVHAHDGLPLRVIGVEGFKPGELKLPRGIVIDNQGFIIVADSGNNRIQVFSLSGSLITAFGTWGTAPGQFKGVEGVALNTSGKLICADRENHRIQIF